MIQLFETTKYYTKTNKYYKSLAHFFMEFTKTTKYYNKTTKYYNSKLLSTTINHYHQVLQLVKTANIYKKGSQKEQPMQMFKTIKAYKKLKPLNTTKNRNL